MRTKWIINILKIVWIIFILNNEFFIFWSFAYKCASPQGKEKIMLVADPQMTDDKSYHNRHFLIMAMTKFYSDLYMKRNYRHLLKSIQPSDIFIMGDLMDNGREWEDEFYNKEVDRFYKIFNKKRDKIHYMVGNHDIGFGNGIDLSKRHRFESYFGNTSYILQTIGGNYSFIVIDTVSLSSTDPMTQASALKVLEESTRYKQNKILMTHVPLYRKSTMSCGPYRQKLSTIITDNFGYQYQNLVSKELSEFILNTVQPIAIFSGDDHDYCKVKHNNAVVEITVPTFSMAQGQRNPGVIILDISSPSLLKYDLCWLPDQIGIFIYYAYFFIFTLFVLFIHHYLQSRRSRYSSHLPLSKDEIMVVTSSRGLFYSIQQVTFVGISTYIFCIILL